jgi:hypothetical protein
MLDPRIVAISVQRGVDFTAALFYRTITALPAALSVIMCSGRPL